jgi:hypothetical protein
MGRKLGSKNKNVNTAKNKNVININVNSSTSKKGRGRPRKQSNDTTQNRQTRHPLGYNPGPSMMAPPQVIVSQPTPQQDNSLLSSFITSRMLNESNMLSSRTNIPTVEPPTTREQPSYFNARESIIPKLPDTPITKPPVIKPADISPSTKIKTGEPAPPPEPTKTDVKPDDVAPPKEKGPLKFYKKLKSAAGTVADAAASDIGISIIESAVNEIDKSHVAATLIGSALRGHRGRKNHAFIKKYPEIVNKRLEDVKRMDPRTELTYKPVGKDEKPEKPAYLQFLEKKREKDQAKLNKALLANPIIGQDLANIETPIQKKAARQIQAALRQKIAKNEYSEKKEQTNAATDIQTAIRQKIAKNKVADKYLEKQKEQQAKTTLSEAVKRKAAYQKVKNIIEDPAKKIQSTFRGYKTRSALAGDKDFQNKINMKIKQYSDAASDLKTRGPDAKGINKEFSDVVKTMRTGLQKYKTTVGIQAKKRGRPKNAPLEF